MRRRADGRGSGTGTAGAGLALGHAFARPELLALALVHRSAAVKVERSNERLEFLGDRVLGLVVADMLYRHFPGEAEGALARRHAALVRREALARVGLALGLPAHLVLARGEEDAGGRDNPAIIADACEAVLGALYLDGGLEAARALIEAQWHPLLAETGPPPKDAKTALQEWAQQRGLPLPTYDTLAADGPDHSPRFTVRVRVTGLPAETAAGPSKRAAAQAAAEALLARARQQGQQQDQQDQDKDPPP